MYSKETYYSALFTAQKNAVARQRNVNQMEKELFDKKAEYNDVMAGRTKASISDKKEGNGEWQ